MVTVKDFQQAVLSMLLMLMLLGVAPVLLAQSEGSQVQSDDDTTVEEVVVIGNRLGTTMVLESAVPVVVLDLDELKLTGASEAGRALQLLEPSFNFSSSSISDGTDALRPATLRGLGPDQVLVLVNGKRRHGSALIHVNTSVGRGTAGVDMNAIPFISTGGVEILRDGAAAQYGSDAIAGVINLKLRELTDGELRFHLGETTESDGEVTQFSVSRGFEIANDGFIFASYEYRDRGRTNRSGDMGTVNYPLKDPNLDPTNCDANSIANCNDKEAGLDRDKLFRLGDGESEQNTLVINSELPLTDKATLYGFFTWSDRDNLAGGFYRQANDAARNVDTVYPDGFLPLINALVEDTSLAAGVRTELAGWDMDFSWSWGENTFDFKIKNTINASLGATSPREADSGSLELSSSSFNIDAAREYSAGWVLAWGFELREEEYAIKAGEPASYCGPSDIDENAPTDPNPTPNCDSYASLINANRDKSGGIQVFPGFRPSNALSESRDSWSLYAQSDWTFSNNAQVILALRYEDYDSFGDTIVAKVAGRLPLTPALALRASFNNGFRAPSLQQLYFNNISTQTQNTELVEVGTFRNDSVLAKALGIPELEEETSINYNVGFVYAPHRRFDVSVDAYSIDIEDRIVLSGQLEKPVAPSGGMLTDAQQQIAAIYGDKFGKSQFFINLGETETSGLDVSLRWLPEVPSGSLQVRLTANWTNTTISGNFKAPGLLSGFTTEQVFNAKYRSAIESWQPDSRISLNADYRLGQWQFVANVQRVGSYKIVEEEGQQTFDEVFLVDVKVSYAMSENVVLSVGAQNLFDEYPDEYAIDDDNPRGGTIQGIVNSPGVFQYARQSAPFGFNGAYYFIALEYSLGETF